MAPIWLVRFNNLLVWLNRALVVVAWVLAAMVAVAASEHVPRSAAGPVMQTARPVARPAPVACPPKLPPELEALRLYD
ncbi:hypothetical protein JQ604_36495 [Bradyrhizobium jicamae]|uniref:hypothetical protein n=1 Tax=Bradyrhizobium jicamae TaxID=280332 RepID=UPI001BAA7516|nr:hypothetical protein [Bradyrhizobium jicamae]MBR0757710.1 hypothetical protein [Bradyrhizobium jicamae]